MSSLINASMGSPHATREWQRKEQTLFVSADASPLRYELLTGRVERATGQQIVTTPQALLSSTKLKKAAKGHIPSEMTKVDPYTFSFP